MLIVETIGRVRRDHFVGKKGIKRIARERGLSRNTVRKILRSEETAFSYERVSVISLFEGLPSRLFDGLPAFASRSL